MARILERVCTRCCPLARGWSVACMDEPGQIAAVVPAVRPEVLVAPPRVWEQLAARSKASEALRSVGLVATRVALVAPEPCQAELVTFWHGRTLLLSEVYGLPETTGVVSINRPAGPSALPGIELATSEQGEVLMRGDVIMRGYRNRAEAAAAAINTEGWLRACVPAVYAPAGALTH